MLFQLLPTHSGAISWCLNAEVGIDPLHNNNLVITDSLRKFLHETNLVLNCKLITDDNKFMQ